MINSRTQNPSLLASKQSNVDPPLNGRSPGADSACHTNLGSGLGHECEKAVIAGQQTVTFLPNRPVRKVTLLEQALLTIQFEWLTGS